MEFKKQEEFEIRLVNFQHRNTRLTSSLPRNPANINTISQLSRCVSSMGANYKEACGAESKRDFLHKINICLKEADEAHYWLLVIKKNNAYLSDKMTELIQESDELVRIFGKIVSTTKKNLNNQ